MRTLVAVCLTMVTAAALCAAAATASAVALPEFSVETNGTGTAGTATLETGAAIIGKIVCTGGTAEGTATSTHGATFHAHLTNCICKKTAALGGGTAKAESLGDGAGVILSLGTSLLVRIASGQVGVLYLDQPFDVDCLYATEELLNFKGSVLSLITPILTTTKTFKIAGGRSEFENEGGTKVKVEGLETEVANTGGFSKSTGESQNTVLSTAEVTEIVKTT
jgi:hypothetical protein